MSITRDHGNIIFECDDCGALLETETKDFEEALSDLRREDWHSYKSKNQWFHRCPMCNEL